MSLRSDVQGVRESLNGALENRDNPTAALRWIRIAREGCEATERALLAAGSDQGDPSSPTAPTPPHLSDEDRERLLAMADALENDRPLPPHADTHRWLRGLAGQPSEDGR